MGQAVTPDQKVTTLMTDQTHTVILIMTEAVVLRLMDQRVKLLERKFALCA
tara:strand:- start:3503 stop:3655 length:153 start_codon:yes stop_codon:yes gene_type:complete